MSKSELFVPRIYQCGKCKDIIWSRYHGHFCGCECGASYIDDTGLYFRYSGDCKSYKGNITLAMLRAADKIIRTINKVLKVT